jgi:putative flippase GtrA
MIHQYLKFFINGGILGIIAWGLQTLIYKSMNGDSALAYGFASAITYIPLVFINFLIQRYWIFNRPGFLSRFIMANLFIMALVSALSPVCRVLIDLVVGAPWGDRGGFILAALLGSIPSFLIKRSMVFGKIPGGAP